MPTKKSIKLIKSGIFFLGLSYSLAWAGEPGPLRTVWDAAAPERPLVLLSGEDLRHLRQQREREMDASTGQKVWRKGPLMSSVVEKAMDGLSNSDKAQVDLIVLKTGSGAEIQVPRWLITKYPVILALSGNSLRLVLPFRSHPDIRKEGLPLGSYAVSDIVEVDLSNYAKSYGPLLLKRRMDPVALRGEKLFVENCTSCHSAGIDGEAAPVSVSVHEGQPLSMAELTGEGKARRLASGDHPAVKNLPRLSKPELRALGSYLRAFRLENPVMTNQRGAVPSSKSVTRTGWAVVRMEKTAPDTR